jgi:hypothetical protein
MSYKAFVSLSARSAALQLLVFHASRYSENLRFNVWL